MPTRPPTLGRTAPAPRAPDPRESASRRGYSPRWSAYARRFLACQPLCSACAKAGRTALACLVDHIHPVTRGEADPHFWDPANHQPLCRRCHAKKTHADRRAGLTRTPKQRP